MAKMETFFAGVHHPNMGWPLSMHGVQVCISANVLVKSDHHIPFVGSCEGWMLDSGAFTQIDRHGAFTQSVEDYAAMIRRYDRHQAWCWKNGRGFRNLRVAVSQDYMCEDVALSKTGLSVRDHQRLTIERYDQIRAAMDAEGVETVPLMPVLQGATPEDYRRHLVDYGDRISPGMWVGVGSVCKRQGDPKLIAFILRGVLQDRPDLRLHGFGVKKTALKSPAVRSALHTADSMAWSFAARMEGRDPNDWAEALKFAQEIMGQPVEDLGPKIGWRPRRPVRQAKPASPQLSLGL